MKAFEGGIIPTAAALLSEGKEGLVVLPGVGRLLEELRQVDPKTKEEGREGFAIVTSATADCTFLPNVKGKGKSSERT